jgi:hypothetical protein
LFAELEGSLDLFSVDELAKMRNTVVVIQRKGDA